MNVPEVDSRRRIIIPEVKPKDRFTIRAKGNRIALIPTEETGKDVATADERRRVIIPAEPGALYRVVARPKGLILQRVEIVDLAEETEE